MSLYDKLSLEFLASCYVVDEPIYILGMNPKKNIAMSIPTAMNIPTDSPPGRRF